MALSCLRFTWITINYQPVMSWECQCGQGGGSDIENISCLGFTWCLFRNVLWMPVFENYWGNGFDSCSMEKLVWKAFVEPHLVVQAKVVGHLLKERSFFPSLIFLHLLWSPLISWYSLDGPGKSSGTSAEGEIFFDKPEVQLGKLSDVRLQERPC